MLDTSSPPAAIRDPDSDNVTAPRVSLIIRTFNEQKHLDALFDAIDSQTEQNYETIVIDSGSFDRTREIAERRADRLIRISSHDFTFGFSLNTGIRAARGEFMAIVSAHTIPVDEHWLKNLLEPFGDEKVAMVYGRQEPVPSSKFSEAEDFKRIFGAEAREEDFDNPVANNANSAIRRALWHEYPFDETLTGLEDIDWARHWMKNGYRVLYIPDASLHHIHEESWPQVRRRYFREAVARRQMGLSGPRHGFREAVADAGRAVVDTYKAIFDRENPVRVRLSLKQRLKEIVQFRYYKAIGTVHGLMDDHPLETRVAQEEVFFDRHTDAVVISEPGQASLTKIPLPELKPGEALINVSHVAVCATDLEILDGSLGYYKSGITDYPIVPGHEFSGYVVATGQNIDYLQEGDRVVVECIQSCGTCRECRLGNFIGCPDRTEVGVLGRNGAYAGHMISPAKFVHKIPDDLDLRKAVLAEPLAVTLKGLRRLGTALTERPRRCAVLGAGPLGHLVARVLANNGHTVVAYDRNPKRQTLFRDTDIEARGDLDHLGDYNVIVEVTGDPGVLDRALRESPANATILLLGLPYGERAFSFEQIAAFDKTVTGSVGSTKEDFVDAVKLLPDLGLEPYFENPMPLSEFDEAWRLAREGSVFKVILDI